MNIINLTGMSVSVQGAEPETTTTIPSHGKIEGGNTPGTYQLVPRGRGQSFTVERLKPLLRVQPLAHRVGPLRVNDRQIQTGITLPWIHRILNSPTAQWGFLVTEEVAKEVWLQSPTLREQLFVLKKVKGQTLPVVTRFVQKEDK